jgi:hypothetical protein
MLACPAPPWLAEVFSRFSFDVATQHHLDVLSPTRVKQYRALTAAQQDAFRLLDFLQKPLAFDFLAAHLTEADALREQLQPLLSVHRGFPNWL